ncbi:hypothetical protein EV127DRAFT_428383 [Xylaria flabelliformis]|nr:hypothetical protein EV127DRAFT_428383 [Xylaria flabelliformis]
MCIIVFVLVVLANASSTSDFQRWVSFDKKTILENHLTNRDVGEGEGQNSTYQAFHQKFQQRIIAQSRVIG